MRRSFLLLAVLAALLAGGCGSDEGEGALDVPDGFWGVTPAVSPNDADVALMATGGLETYHVQLNWARVEVEKGTYNFQPYDLLFAQLARQGIQPVPYLLGTAKPYGDAVTDAPFEGDALEAWRRFVRAATVRYGPDGQFWKLFAAAEPEVDPVPVRVWEVWNEMNSSVFWTPEPDPEAYSRLLLGTADAIRSVDPEAEIMTGGMFATPNSDGAITSFRFLRQLYGIDGVAEAVDIVGVHPYSPNVDGVIEQMDLTAKAIETSGDDASTWITEIGWGSDPDVPNQLAKSPEEQAALLEESFGELATGRDTWNLRGVIWFTWRDDPIAGQGGCGWCPSAGLVDSDRDAKPSWDAYTGLTGGET